MDKFNGQVAELEKLLREKLSVRGNGLSHQLKRTGRLLPKRLQKAGQLISDAMLAVDHPKLARLQDPAVIDTAFMALKTHLEEIDPTDRRKGMILGILGGLVFNLLVLLGVTILFLHWQDVI